MYIDIGIERPQTCLQPADFVWVRLKCANLQNLPHRMMSPSFMISQFHHLARPKNNQRRVQLKQIITLYHMIVRKY